MISQLAQFIQKYWSILAYLFFGVCTTLINLLIYWLSTDIFQLANIPSTIIAWIFAVIFAFITNKLYVFDSKSIEKTTVARELSSFLIARLLTGLLDLLIMYLAVDLLFQPKLFWKIISNILVIILNYIASKLFIFRSETIKK